MLNIKLYADGANIDDISRLANDNMISGFTTNPTLMKAAGVSDYLGFAKKVVSVTNGKPISLEVFSDDLQEMKRQALVLSKLSNLVYVKIPVTNTKGQKTETIITELLDLGVKVNVTAVFSIKQITSVATAAKKSISATPLVISVFAGRIADTGVDPIPHMKKAKGVCTSVKNCELLWASPREVLNVFQANDCGCDIITATPQVLEKLSKLQGKNLEDFSLETVKMFYNDAKSAGYQL